MDASDSETDAEPDSPSLLESSPQSTPTAYPLTKSHSSDEATMRAQLAALQHKLGGTNSQLMKEIQQSTFSLDSLNICEPSSTRSSVEPRWKVTQDKTTGKRYYWHTVTREVRWDLEPHLMQQAHQPGGSSESQLYHYSQPELNTSSSQQAHQPGGSQSQLYHNSQPELNTSSSQQAHQPGGSQSQTQATEAS